MSARTHLNSTQASVSPYVGLNLASEKINDTDSFSQLPEEIILRTFGFLNAIHQAKCGGVSRRWRRLVSDETLLAAFNPRNLSPLLKVFDESDWVTRVELSDYGLTTGDIPPCDVRKVATHLERVLSSPLMTKIEKDAGITLLTIPKGLTLNKLVKLVGSPKVGNIPKFNYICDRISSEIGNIPVEKTYQIVITNNIFKKSRRLSVSDQKTLMSEIGCEMPKVLEATVLLVVTFMVSGDQGYKYNNPWTYTLCSELVDNKISVVGGLCFDGFTVDFTPWTDDGVYGAFGVLQHFKAVGDWHFSTCV